MVTARTGAAAQAVNTRARARQGVAVDAGDSSIGGSRLWQQGLSEDWGGEEMK